MPEYDRFELTPKGEIRINRRDLIDIIYEIELPYAQKEYEARVATEENPEELRMIAGDYIYPPPSQFFLPCRNLLDEPECVAEKGFVYRKDAESYKGKALLLECTCGITECWFLEARIEIKAQYVRWYDFSQFHRDWEYDLEFIFEKGPYEAQLEPR